MSKHVFSASGLIALGLVATLAADQVRAQDNYEATCITLSGNARSDDTVCEGVRITDGINDISADLASTNKFDFDGSLWKLSGNVRLAFDTTEILATEALFEFQQDELVRAELSGNPVVMSDFIEEENKTVRGVAGSVSYDNPDGTLRLLGQVTLTVGENEFRGCDWIYNFNEKSYRAGTTADCTGVTIVLAPPEASDNSAVQPGSP